MQFKVDRATLIKLTSRAVDITTEKSTVQVLSHLLFEVFEGKLHVTATDTEQSFRGSMDVEMIHPGRVTVPAATFASVLPVVGSEEVTIEADLRNYVKVSGGNGRVFTIYGSSAAAFPAIADASTGDVFEFPPQELMTAIDNTVFAVSTDALRFYLRGIYISKEENEPVKFVATDSRRLAIYTSSVTEVPEFEAIVPANTMRVVRKMLEPGSEVAITVDEKRIVFRIDSAIVSTSLIDGRFPNYKSVLPESSSTMITVQRDELLDGMDSVSRLLDKDAPQIKFQCSSEGVDIESHSSHKGTGSTRVPIEEYSGPESMVGVSCKYMKDAVSHLPKGSTLRVGISNVSDPIVIRAVGVEWMLHIVMPMRLENQ